MNLKFLSFLLMTALINSAIELEISVPSFLVIADRFDISEAVVGLTITYNLVGFCLGALIYGPLSECYGRRKIMIIGNAVLTIGAFGCVIAPSIDWLIAARFIQGLGAATSAVIVSAIIADVYSVNQAAKLYGYMNACFTALMALAPLLGGFISNTIGWRGNYGFVAIVCIISWVLLFFFLSETRSDRAQFSLKKIVADYKVLLSSPAFLVSLTIPSLLYGCYLIFVAASPFIYMQAFRLDILTYALHQGVIAGIFALTSLFSGKITSIVGMNKSVYSGLTLISFGSVFMLSVNAPYLLTASMSLFGIGFAVLYPIIFSYSLEIFPSMRGSSSSAIMSMRYFLCSGLAGISCYLYDGTLISISSIIFTVTVLIVIVTGYLMKKFLTSKVNMR